MSRQAILLQRWSFSLPYLTCEMSSDSWTSLPHCLLEIPVKLCNLHYGGQRNSFYTEMERKKELLRSSFLARSLSTLCVDRPTGCCSCCCATRVKLKASKHRSCALESVHRLEQRREEERRRGAAWEIPSKCCKRQTHMDVHDGDGGRCELYPSARDANLGKRLKLEKGRKIRNKGGNEISCTSTRRGSS